MTREEMLAEYTKLKAENIQLKREIIHGGRVNPMRQDVVIAPKSKTQTVSNVTGKVIEDMSKPELDAHITLCLELAKRQAMENEIECLKHNIAMRKQG